MEKCVNGPDGCDRLEMNTTKLSVYPRNVSNDMLIVAEESAFFAPQINGKIAIFPDKAVEPKLHSSRSSVPLERG